MQLRSSFLNLFKYLVPSIFSSMTFFLFGIIDGIFVGNGVGTNALGAINICQPYFYVAYAFVLLATIGAASLTAIAIGEGNIKQANILFNASLFLTTLTGLIISLIGIIFARPIGYFLGATEDYIDMVASYIFIRNCFGFFDGIAVCFENFSRNDNDPNIVLISTLASTTLNIFLDYTFIFIFKWGVQGAALATGISYIFHLIIVSYHFLMKKGVLRIKLSIPSFKLAKEIFLRGLPEFISQFAIPVTTFCLNNIINRFIGIIGLNTYALLNYIATFSYGILYGCSEGLQPLFGQSYGQRNFKLLRFYLISGLTIILISSSVICFLSIHFISNLGALFNVNSQTAFYAHNVIKQFIWAYIFTGLNACISTFLYSIKKTKKAILFNILRSLVINSSCIIFLPIILGSNIIWLSYGVAEVIIFIIAIFLLSKVKELKFV